LDLARKKKIKPLVVGGMTNVLWPDTDLELVIQLVAGEEKVMISDEGEVKAWAGIPMGVVAQESVARGYMGLESFASLPGSVGGAIWNNAHFGGEFIGDRLQEIEYYQMEMEEVVIKQRAELDLGYDHSLLQKSDGAIITATWRLKRSENEEWLRAKMTAARRKRQASQPLTIPSAGCFWKNPDNTPELEKLFPQWAGKERISAGFLIEQAGFKGKRLGGVAVSEKHSAFIVNLGGGKSEEVRALAAQVREKVKEKFGVELESEVAVIE
jgi:UDP-N-acetylmuramate dehydrogenase